MEGKTQPSSPAYIELANQRVCAGWFCHSATGDYFAPNNLREELDREILISDIEVKFPFRAL